MRFKFVMVSLLVILITVPSIAADAVFLIADGSVITKGFQYTHFVPESNQYNIEYAINVSFTQTMDITSISADVVEFEYNRSVNIESAYQKVNESIFTSTDYGLRYYDQNGNLLSTGGPTYTGVQRIRKSDGVVLYHERPEGASLLTVAVYFNEPTIFSRIAMWPAWMVKKGGETTTIFLANVANLNVGESFDHPNFEDYEVSGIGEYQGFATWIIEPEELVCEGCDISSFDRWQFEKNSGLLLERYCTVSMPTFCNYTMYTWRSQFADVIMAPQDDTLFLLVGISGIGIACVVVGVYVLKKRGTI